MNKGKKIIQNMADKKYVCYRCNRCGVIVHETKWKNDTHSKCDIFRKAKANRDKAEKTALQAFIQIKGG